ncbi:hypothetical protein KAR48_02450 [bacterium]|nr:hypothetical protein [bacterium]
MKMHVTHRSLYFLAAFTWYFGVIKLFTKGLSKFFDATILNPSVDPPYWVFAVAIIIGLIQASTVFRKACHKNLIRIAALEKPEIWQFLRPGFIIFLFCMIIIGMLISKLTEGHYLPMLLDAVLNLSLSISLFGSSVLFWKHRVFF